MKDRERTKWAIAAAVVVVLSAVLPGCQTNPVTGRSQFNALSRSEEIAIGEEAMPELIEGYGGRVPDSEVNAYVTSVGMRLARETELDYPEMPWEFTFLNSDVINAFALPGGKVFVSRGLVEKMDNEAQLAGVLGHEIGHVTGQHADDAVGRQMILAGIAIGGAIVAGTSDDQAVQIGASVLVAGSGVFALTFSRSQEIEADTLGMRYMTRAGYAPEGMYEVMEILEEASKGGSPPEFLSTHPHPKTRMEKIRKRLANEYAFTENNPDYQFNTQRFQSECLNRLERLPAAKVSGIDPAHPELWCSVCAANRAGR